MRARDSWHPLMPRDAAVFAASHTTRSDTRTDEEVVNASLQLNSPDGLWYAQAYIKNIFNQNNLTGGDLASTSSGLYTGALYGDPRTYGVTLGIKFD